MQSALHITTTIQPGNKIELQIPDGFIGDTVEVFVILADKATAPPPLTLGLPSAMDRQSILATIDTIHSQQPSRTAAEIEQQIEEARDGWEN